MESVGGSASTISANGVAGTLGGKRIVGYLPRYLLNELNNIDFSKLTNVIYFALRADSSGNLIAESTYLVGFPNVVSTAHAAGVKVSACVGGGQSNRYLSPLANSSTARANFINQLVNFALDHNLDGVDLDWEPVANADVPNYSILIQELKTSLNQHGLLLSIAVNSSHYDIQAWAADYLDFISVMAYDTNWPHAEHSNYKKSVAAMTRWANYGVLKSKLLMGIPFFGRNEGWTSARTYAEIVDKYNPAPDQNWTPDNVYFFNGIDLVKNKTAYVYENGFGGMMIWNLGQDKYDGLSLLAAMVPYYSLATVSSSLNGPVERGGASDGVKIYVAGDVRNHGDFYGSHYALVSALQSSFA